MVAKHRLGTAHGAARAGRRVPPGVWAGRAAGRLGRARAAGVWAVQSSAGTSTTSRSTEYHVPLHPSGAPGSSEPCGT